MTQHKDWSGILKDGETITWQGRPEARLEWDWFYAITIFFGLLVMTVGLFWGRELVQEGGYLWLLGAMIFVIGLILLIAPIFYPYYRRRRTWYSLSDQRAFIATDMAILGKKIRSYDINEFTPISLIGEVPQTVIFSILTYNTGDGPRNSLYGFERIHDAKDVHKRLLEMQKKATP